MAQNFSSRAATRKIFRPPLWGLGYAFPENEVSQNVCNCISRDI